MPRPDRACSKCGSVIDGPHCNPCRVAYMIAWRHANSEEIQAYAARWHTRNREQQNLRSKVWRMKNPDKAKEQWKASLERHKHTKKEHDRQKRLKNKESILASNKAYHEKNPGLRTLWDANYRANKRQATPKWANQFFISEAYKLAKLREWVCGGKWHVDHMVPLQSKLVCGLHVESNLQVISASANHRKSNVQWPDMP